MAKKKERIPFFDNARIILVTMVVFGHLIAPLYHKHDIMPLVNDLLSTFRMPALILLTGFFSKGFLKEGYIQKITLRVLVPYLILQYVFGYYFYAVIGTRQSFSVDPFVPQYAMWFFFSLFCWNMMLFIFTRLRRPIVVSFVIAIAVGMIDSVGNYLGLSRTFVYFPIFLIGHYLKKEHFMWFQTKAAKAWSIVFVGLIVIVERLWLDEKIRTLLTGKYSYEELQVSLAEGSFLRFLTYVLMFLGSAAFFAWVPKKNYFFTTLGSRTAFVYVLHLFFIQYVRSIGWYDDMTRYEAYTIPFIAILIALVTTTKPVMYLTKPIVTFESPFPTRKKKSTSYQAKELP